MTQEVYEGIMDKLNEMSQEVLDILEAMRPDPIITMQERLDMLDEMI